jgi:hypothetical protein
MSPTNIAQIMGASGNALGAQSALGAGEIASDNFKTLMQGGPQAAGAQAALFNALANMQIAQGVG